MKRAINTLMIVSVCIIEFILSLADALEIAELNGEQLMMLTLVQLVFIYSEGKCNRQDYAANCRKQRIIKRTMKNVKANRRRA
ncbi:MAG: hypothetical protein MJ095_00090 [Oscillospiraceae bacterium]|nr:hypothetical protein [Oscillospiraceae bacterium]